MKDILANFSVVDTGQRKLVGAPPPVSVNSTCTKITETPYLDARETHRLQATISVEFSANAAEYGCVLANARQLIRDSIYRGLLEELRVLRHHLHESDIVSAHETIDRIVTGVRG